MPSDTIKRNVAEVRAVADTDPERIAEAGRRAMQKRLAPRAPFTVVVTDEMIQAVAMAYADLMVRGCFITADALTHILAYIDRLEAVARSLDVILRTHSGYECARDALDALERNE